MAPTRGLGERPGTAVTALRVRVRPKASRNQVIGYRDNVLQVSVTAPPEAGKANAAVTSLLAETLGIAKSRVRITQGHTSRNKRLEIESLEEPELRQRLGIPGEQAE